MTFLDTINTPADLRKLPVEALPHLAKEIREFMVDIVSKTGGHLAPSLGAVELTIALHYSYNTPVDKLVWDVGHQAYAHKILTGRKDRFNTLRQYGGISGFPKVSESEYDTSTSGHASTSISTALGIALARDLLKQDHAVVAVIGDGALSGGLSFEGLNNLGSHSTDLTIVLNDNEMSISRNVGALSRYLTRVITDKRYYKIKNEIWDMLGNFSDVGKRIRSAVSSIDDSLKHLLIPGKLFHDIGIRYLGPIDGHNIPAMLEVFKSVKEHSREPVIVHLLTKKGKGFSFAEENATKYHGIGCFSVSTGEAIKGAGTRLSYSEVFGRALVELGRTRTDIVAITAAMRDGTGLAEFSKEFPDRFFDVGIAESHAVTFAAGLAHKGFRPVVAIYSTFLQRSLDQIIHDVALDALPVVFAIDRAGLVGDDGPTHHGAFDLSYLRAVPGAVIMAPCNEAELRAMLSTALAYTQGPVFIRYPRGCGPGAPIDRPAETLPIGLPEIVRRGSKGAIVVVGDFMSLAEKALSLLKTGTAGPTLVNARFVKPLDAGFYRKLFTEHHAIMTLENNTIRGGFGSALLELASELQLEKPPKFMTLGLPDAFIQHGDLDRLLASAGLDRETIAKKFAGFIKD
ncbi:MAG: 1-deoxy-D-xylulose-5-phosphate synthase [Chitinispirillaceae bacterium]|nr:1-deoxy-D-xylulose-5-phosphate synthase [Chitinispirillaceae bacterium]